MILSLIAAYDKHHVIGHAGSIPWKIPADLKFFRETTIGRPIIMGRKTYESIGHPLPKRMNIVVTRQAGYQPHHEVVVVGSLEEALRVAQVSMENDGKDEAFVIGGGELYRAALPTADKLYITEVEAEFPGDTFFPEINHQEWQEQSRQTIRNEETGGYTIHFVIYVRKK